MLKTTLIAVCFFLFAGITSAQDAKKLSITELETYISESDTPLIISFWATWCAPCLEEMPYLQEAAKKYADKGVSLVLISLDSEKAFPAKINEFIRKKGIKASIFWLNETNADYFCPRIDPEWSGAIPATLFVNNGLKRRNFFERQLSKEEIYEEVGKLVIGDR